MKISAIARHSAKSSSVYGYKIVGYDPDKKRAFSLYEPSMDADTAVGKTVKYPGKGLFIGTTRKFCLDYYSGLTDMEELMLTYEISPSDILTGTPEREGEMSVRRAKLVKVEKLGNEERRAKAKMKKMVLSSSDKKPWEMTRAEIEDILRTGDKNDVPKLREVLRALRWDEGYSRANDPWGTWRTVHVGDELPRVPLVELSRRRRAMVQEAVSRGDEIPPQVLSELGMLKAETKSSTVKFFTQIPISFTKISQESQEIPDDEELDLNQVITVYRGVNPKRNRVAKKDPTHGLWFTTTYEDAASYANWDYEGSGELGPGRAILSVDITLSDAFEYAQAGSRRRIEDPEELLDPDSPVEMILPYSVATTATLFEGDPVQGELGRAGGRR
jgi:hypothetical protein